MRISGALDLEYGAKELLSTIRALEEFYCANAHLLLPIIMPAFIKGYAGGETR
jgi:hypothetical protein